MLNDLCFLFHVWQCCAILSHDPGDDLEHRIWNVLVLLEHLEIYGNCRFSELFTIDSLLIVTDTLNELIG
jgi:hypothetical protein